jgi:aromatic-L-amino-acid decarboxylase
VAGIRARLADALALTRRLEATIDASRDFERLAASPFALICFRAFPRDLRAAYADAPPPMRAAILTYLARLNGEILDRINNSGTAFLALTVLREGYTLRVSIGNIRTEARHVDALWAALHTAAADIDAALATEGVRPPVG